MDSYKDDEIEIKIVKGPLKKVLAVLNDEEKEHVLKSMTKNYQNRLPPEKFMNSVRDYIRTTPDAILGDLQHSPQSRLDFCAQLFTYFISLCKNLEDTGEITIPKEKRND